MTGLFQNRASQRPVRALALSIVAASIAPPAHAQQVNPTSMCDQREVMESFRNTVGEWSRRQVILVNWMERSHGRPATWSVLNAKFLTHIPAASASNQNRHHQASICQADFRYSTVPAATGPELDDQFRINSIVYRATPAERGGSPTVEILSLPQSINTPTDAVAMGERITLSNISLSRIFEKMREDRAQSNRQAPSTAPAKPATTHPQGRPGNVVSAMTETFGQYNRELEAEMRRQGAGDIVDAERSRRAALTPKDRAAEDAWNLGPRKGETMCREEHGVTRCKTGR
ncbi:hypothetical protein M2336_000299 [Sphingobium sp. B1D7B]|uniref:hypothetical protein n=1 Tax=unclassified Sphingobium TaxID=2611147 RepID=UPI002224F211|nr:MULTISPECIES: hypothetical protein [unclassified Sphingobium]MCW2391914.1 hypothetical protein [Sphingobium sp. B11D3A]MCW2403670.1 hypothetical protein [Sphingobium sp. B1D7B]